MMEGKTIKPDGSGAYEGERCGFLAFSRGIEVPIGAKVEIESDEYGSYISIKVNGVEKHDPERERKLQEDFIADAKVRLGVRHG